MSKTKTNKKISVSTIMKIAGAEPEEPKVITYGDEKEKVEVSVKTFLSLNERIAMIDDVIDMVFLTGDDGKCVYYPSIKKFAVTYAFVNYFTNISLPTDSNAAWYFFEKTSIADKIIDSLGDKYFSEILAQINEAIEYKRQTLIKASKLDTIIDSIIDIIQTLSDKTKDIELPQLLEFAQKNAPEFKEALERMIKTAETSPAASE